MPFAWLIFTLVPFANASWVSRIRTLSASALFHDTSNKSHSMGTRHQNPSSPSRQMGRPCNFSARTKVLHRSVDTGHIPKSYYSEELIMLMSKSVSGAAIAAAAALLFSIVSISTAVADEAKVHCTGVNSCKGQSSCKGADNSCKGQNSCKGKGFKEMTQKDCDAAKAEQGK